MCPLVIFTKVSESAAVMKTFNDCNQRAEVYFMEKSYLKKMDSFFPHPGSKLLLLKLSLINLPFTFERVLPV